MAERFFYKEANGYWTWTGCKKEYKSYDEMMADFADFKAAEESKSPPEPETSPAINTIITPNIETPAV